MLLGIDCGTQGTKALLVDEHGKSLGRGYARHSLIERPNGAREQEPSWWIDAFKVAVHAALAEAPRTMVRAVGISGQQHGLVVLGENFEVIRPAKLWNDTETSAQNAELIERFGGNKIFLERFGIAPLTGYTVSKLLWLQQHEPANFEKIRYICLPHDYLNFWLTGELSAEYGDASGTGYFDVRSRTWIKEILDEIDGGTGQLFRALPRLVEPTSILGKVLPGIAEELGISPECVVAAGGGDNMMGALGTGNVVEGVVTLSLGTSSTVYSFREQAMSQTNADVAPFCSSSGGWLPLVCTMNATNVVTSTLHLVGKTVAELDSALCDTAPGADGLVFLPFLNGERTPDLPDARGSLHGISSTNYSPDNLIRAAVEGVTFGILSGLDAILEGDQAEVIIVIGGGARSKEWKQLIADATGALVQTPVEEESGCLGACVQAMVALSNYEKTPLTFSQVASLFVHLDVSSAISPNLERRTGYNAARASYASYLATSYPQLQLGTAD